MRRQAAPEVLTARALAGFGGDPRRYAGAEARRTAPAVHAEARRTAPAARACGRKKVMTGRHVRNDRLVDSLIAQASSALRARCLTLPATSRQQTGLPAGRLPRPAQAEHCIGCAR